MYKRWMGGIYVAGSALHGKIGRQDEAEKGLRAGVLHDAVPSPAQQAVR